ncbi:DUF1992 domain-containing protein [Nocardia sp. NPDC049190]|uniref:DnaJ family domain-containing protein n=1 Tax=Nocardia sp. NPDC049190 TaxID=3155650 RepID=UPI0033E98960
MTERKPSDLDFESWIDKQIREATERGEFDNLAGQGKPIPGSGARLDEDWWLREYLRREGVGGDALLPPSLLLRRDVERLPDTVRELNSERQVRDTVAELNKRIVDWLRMPYGPFVPISPVRADEVVRWWRTGLEQERASRSPSARPLAARPDRTATERRRWWHRLTGRGTRGHGRHSGT